MSKTYKRIAERQYSIGDVLAGGGTKPLQNQFPNVEEILERNRPTSIANRGDCVYMRDDEDFSTVGVPYDKGYVHKVEPIGLVYKRDIY